MNKKTVVTVPMGDPAGIGPEIALKSMSDPQIWDEGTPLLVGDLAVLEAVRDAVKLDVGLHAAGEGTAVSGSPTDIPVVDLGMVPLLSELSPGRVSPLAGRASAAYIEKAVHLCMSGTADGMATTPDLLGRLK